MPLWQIFLAVMISCFIVGFFYARTYRKVIAQRGVLLENKWYSFILADKVELADSVFQLRFVLPNINKRLGFLPCTYMVMKEFDAFKGQIEKYVPQSQSTELAKKSIMFQCYPINNVKVQGYFDICLRIQQPELKKILHKQSDELISSMFKGPFGEVSYLGKGNFLIKEDLLKVKNVGIIAYDIGITCAWSLIQTIINDKKDSTSIFLIYKELSIKTLLFWEEMVGLYNKKKIEELHLILNEIPPNLQNIEDYNVGQNIDRDLILNCMPNRGDDTIILVCGIKVECLDLLKEMEYVNVHHLKLA